jgi:DNA-damage-inducible protein D
MTDGIIPFEPVPEDDGSTFEESGHDNGFRYWWESDVRRLLGYEPGAPWDKAKGRAMAACAALGIAVQENFLHDTREDADGDPVHDCKLSRFACYLIAMNGDPRKAEVARAQAYFATFAEAARRMAISLDGVERVVVRDEMIDREKSLASAAKHAGVDGARGYALFQNAGYRGLYNMNLTQLKMIKGIDGDRTLLDFMGKEELAANLFRITQTESKIRAEKVRGQMNLERTAEGVGKQVRKAIQEIGGTMPERLPPAEDLKTVKSDLKKTARELTKMDVKKRLPGKK